MSTETFKETTQNSGKYSHCIPSVPTRGTKLCEETVPTSTTIQPFIIQGRSKTPITRIRPPHACSPGRKPRRFARTIGMPNNEGIRRQPLPREVGGVKL